MTARYAVALAALMSLVSARAAAELYSFEDEEGVIHFTNIPNDPRYKPQAVEKARNTYMWNDQLGALYKVHRVNVRDFDDTIVAAARYYSLPPALVKAVIAVESSFEVTAVSPKGAQGLMQLIAQTAIEMHVRDVFDARDNIYGGTRYLRILANRFGGDLRHTIAAYNAGPGSVEQAKGVPPFDETRRYVQRVIALYKHYLSTWKSDN